MARSKLSKSSLLFVPAAALLLSGCPDPEGAYDEFLERTGEQRGGAATCDPSGVFDVNGAFLLAISTTLGPGNPLLFTVETFIDVDDAGDCPAGGCTMDLDVQPIVPFNRTSLGDDCGESGTPVGDLIVLTDIPVAADGTFEASFGQQDVDRCANPITGRPITATIILDGLTVSDDIWAGTARGSVQAPLRAPLGGSTFAATRITGDLDETPAFTCEDAIGTGGAGGTGGGGGGTGGGN